MWGPAHRSSCLTRGPRCWRCLTHCVWGRTGAVFLENNSKKSSYLCLKRDKRNLLALSDAYYYYFLSLDLLGECGYVVGGMDQNFEVKSQRGAMEAPRGATFEMFPEHGPQERLFPSLEHMFKSACSHCSCEPLTLQ